MAADFHDYVFVLSIYTRWYHILRLHLVPFTRRWLRDERLKRTSHARNEIFPDEDEYVSMFSEGPLMSFLLDGFWEIQI